MAIEAVGVVRQVGADVEAGDQRLPVLALRYPVLERADLGVAGEAEDVQRLDRLGGGVALRRTPG
jgi:hypothetical protein